MRTHPGWVEPEVWFRIVHPARSGYNGDPVAAYREQTVEIVFGPHAGDSYSYYSPALCRPWRTRSLSEGFL